MKRRQSVPNDPEVERESAGIENCQRAVLIRLPMLEDFLKKIIYELELENAFVSVRLLTDAAMARLNEEFRKKKGPTDVLSFPSEQRKRPITLVKQVKRVEGKFLGDIAIAPKVAKRNAKELGRDMHEELKVLMLHGVLHLLGYDHETDRGEMDRVEKRLRRRLGIA